MMKRIIALLLALILTVGLLPTVALAAGETPAAGTSNDVKNGYYEGTTWTEGTLDQGKLPTGVESVSKTAKPTSNPNEYEVTLEVVLKKTESQENPGSAATVLVLDHSGSMNGCAYCKSTTDTRGNYYHTEGCKYDKPNEWVRVTSEQSRMSAATKAVKDFIKTYSGRFDENGNETTTADLNLGRWVCLVWFNETGGVTGGSKWVDVSNKSGYQTAINTDGWKAHDGTNLDCGLRLADHWLKQSPVASINKSLKNVIVLSDGEPTYHLSKSWEVGDPLFHYDITIDDIGYYVHGNGGSCDEDTYNTTKSTAATLRNSASVYTVCFGASGNEIKDYDKNGNQKITVGNYLNQKIATQPKSGSNEKFAYDAADADALNTAFAAISKTIVSGLSTGTVKDTLPTGISSTVFGEGKTVMNWELNSDAFNKTEETKPLADGTKETVYTYTKTYTVTIDPDNENLVKTEDGYAPLNGKTTLTVKNSKGENVEIPFPIPAGKVTMPSHTVTWKSQDGITTLETDNNVEYNTQPSFDQADPTKADDAQYTYTFVGWATEANKETGTLEADLPPVTDDVTYYAAFSKTARTYTVTWMPQDGQDTAYETDTGVAYNARPSYDGTEPTKAADAEHTYTFAGWATSANQETGTLEANLPAVTADVTYYAAFSKTPRTYTVTWMPQDGQGNAYETDTSVAYNARPSYDGTEPTKAADAEHTYTFVGWATTPNQTSGSAVDALPNVTADVTYYAAFSATKQTYTIRFETEAGGTLTGTTECTGLSHGADFPAAPTTTSNVGYYFDGWYKDNTKVTSFPTTVTENATYTAKWLSYNSINLDLTGKIQKTLNSDVELSNQSFTINVKQTGAEAASATATATVSATTASGTGYTGSAPFQTATDEFKLTFKAPGTYNYSIVEEQPVRPGMTYDDGFATTGHTMTVVVGEGAEHALSITSVTVDSKSIDLTATDATWLTITNTYTEPKEPRVVSKTVVTTNMVDTLPLSVSNDIAVFKIVNKVDILYPVVNGEASTLEVPYGTKSVTLLYKITVNAGTKTSMQFEDVGAECVSIVDDDDVDVTQVGRTFTVQFYRGVTTADIYVAKTYAKLVFDSNGECTVENVISEEIKATTTVTEKDPNKLTINFADYVQKELAATGTKTASDVDFTVDVKGKEQTTIIASAEGEEAISTYADEFDPKYSRTLTAHFDSITGGEVKTTRFTGTTVEIDHAGYYTFFLGEEKGTRSGVTYDETRYTLYINVRLDQNENKLYVSSMGAIRTNSDGTWENIALIEMENDEPVRTTNYITFHNTIDTGRDDYIPIIIPTIINKDTGMLNKTDHFAYVIGYPDGTVHPNGQITRAEVATIFFRLLRDEVRDGAFTTSNSYSDVAYGKWYNNPISTMSALGIITGYPDGTFKPNKPITRAEFAAIAARFDETQSGKSATFSDVIGHWAAKEIGIAYANEWIKGYPDGTFKPDQNITRAEAMTLINRVLERKPESPADLLTNMNKWTDNMDTSKWYYLDVQEATNSHAYTRKTFNYELWRQMLPDPDWSRYER